MEHYRDALNQLAQTSSKAALQELKELIEDPKYLEFYINEDGKTLERVCHILLERVEANHCKESYAVLLEIAKTFDFLA